MDTLAIPRHDRHEERKRAVQRIGEVYRHAKFTIVLDLALEQLAPGRKYHETAMRILASGWMRRLWTLQEAYLSNKVLFAFRDGILMDLESIEEKYPEARQSLQTNLATTTRALYHLILGPERKAREIQMPAKHPYDVIASVWRSAQWRVSSKFTLSLHDSHELIVPGDRSRPRRDSSSSNATGSRLSERASDGRSV
jgi:hypothetical protein